MIIFTKKNVNLLSSSLLAQRTEGQQKNLNLKVFRQNSQFLDLDHQTYLSYCKGFKYLDKN
jgi:hypothetical protein